MYHTRNDLARIKLGLMERDLQILTIIQKARLITTETIRRLFFYEYPNPATAMRLTRLKLNKLMKLELIKPAGMRVNREKGGRLQNVWMLTVPGYRLLTLEEKNVKAKRFVEPSLTHLNHTIAIAGCYAEIVEACRSEENLNIATAEFEPVCWRDIKKNQRYQLKPDLYIVLKGETGGASFTERSFWEVDLGTENSGALMTKCERYHEYYRTKAEQEKYHNFPMVVWFVMDEKRKKMLTELLQEKYKNHKHLFVIITPEELPEMVRNGVGQEKLL